MKIEQTNRLTNNGHNTDTDDPILSPRVDVAPHVTSAASRKFRIAGDVVAKTTHGLPDDQYSAINWAFGYCRDRDLTCEEFGALLTKPGKNEPYSGDSVYSVFIGRRDPSSGSMENFCQAVQTFRKRVEETAPRNTTAFVETDISRKIFSTCRRAFTKKRVSFIFGESQIGKTTALHEYAQRHNHGETILVRMPTGGALNNFLRELATRLGIGACNKGYDLRRRITECFDDRKLLIVDECEQCLTGNGERGFVSLEFAREIHDKRKCGLVLAGALDFRNALKTNYTLRKLHLRGIAPLHLPTRPGTVALNQFAEAFGLKPAPDKTIGVQLPEDDFPEVPRPLSGNPLAIQTSVIRDYGLGRWLATLEEAADIAKEAGAQTTWGRVILAHALFNQDPI